MTCLCSSEYHTSISNDLTASTGISYRYIKLKIFRTKLQPPRITIASHPVTQAGILRAILDLSLPPSTNHILMTVCLQKIWPASFYITMITAQVQALVSSNL